MDAFCGERIDGSKRATKAIAFQRDTFYWQLLAKPGDNKFNIRGVVPQIRPRGPDFNGVFLLQKDTNQVYFSVSIYTKKHLNAGYVRSLKKPGHVVQQDHKTLVRSTNPSVTFFQAPNELDPPKSPSYRVTRGVLTVNEFNKQYHERKPCTRRMYFKRFKRKLRSFDYRSTIYGICPLYNKLANSYTWRTLAFDIFAGVTVASLHVPQGMAYGQLAGLKPVHGLYTSLFPALVYCVCGSSNHISIGTFSVVSLLSAEPLDRLGSCFAPSNRTVDGYEQELQRYRLEVAVTLTVVVGLIQFVLGVMNLGFLVVYVSAPILSGFTCGAAIHVLANQLNGLFGIQMERCLGPGRLIFTTANFIRIVKNGNMIAMLISAVCAIVLAVFKFFVNPKVVQKLKFPIPIELIVLIGGTMVSHFGCLNQRCGIKIMGALPQGLPSPMMPNFRLVPEIITDAAIVSFVSLATTVSLVKLYAVKYGYDVPYTKEMSTLGLANVVGGFLQCHACSGGLARSTVAVGAGQRSQVATLVACSVLILVLTSVGRLLGSLPMCVLASIITVSLTGILRQMSELPKLYRTSPLDVAVWFVTFAATVLIDIPIGLLSGVGFSLLTILYRTQVSFGHELGNLEGTDIYVDCERYAEAKKIPGILILRFGGPLYYANGEQFQNWINKATKLNPKKIFAQRTHATEKEMKHSFPVCSSCCGCVVSDAEITVKKSGDGFHSREENGWLKEELKFVILDISSWTFVDSVGARALKDVIAEYSAVGVQFLLTSCQPKIKRVLISAGLPSEELENHSFLTVHDASTYALWYMVKTDGPLSGVNEGAQGDSLAGQDEANMILH
ncbi:unnamed protein product [Calicophoron daubneyi]|uniref:STAS domain-containing protein n=1 Tax=Calicophoron daubneyi TaxID=300641 RepID=A0AAV2TI34_CALDB